MNSEAKKMKSKRKIRGIALLAVGFLLFAVAGFWLGSNFYEDAAAGKQSAEILKEIEKEPNRGNSDSVIKIKNNSFCGTVEINKLGVKLPVFDEFSDSNLKNAPCRYSGSVENNDMIIVAHNYRSHFGSLKRLSKNDEIIFTDAFGDKHIYIVNKIVNLGKTDVEQMKSGKWDFTLFTCTTNREHRVTVRCTKKLGGK